MPTHTYYRSRDSRHVHEGEKAAMVRACIQNIKRETYGESVTLALKTTKINKRLNIDGSYSFGYKI